MNGLATHDDVNAGVCYRKVICLPNNLEIALGSAEQCFVCDIGGSLAKIAYYKYAQSHTSTSASCTDNVQRRPIELHLVCFDTDDVDLWLKFISIHVLQGAQCSTSILATGVGAIKYKTRIEDTLQTQLQVTCDEMSYACDGLSYLWSILPRSELLYGESVTDGLVFNTTLCRSHIMPYLMVNVGSALTISKVSDDGTSSCPIVGGSSFGGLSFLGLAALIPQLTHIQSFKDLISLAEEGNHYNVDLSVADTAGAGYSIATANQLVSSMGKVAKLRDKGTAPSSHKASDIASSLLCCISDSVAQNVYLTAQHTSIHRVVFCGSFLTGNHTSRAFINSKLLAAQQLFGHKVDVLYVQNENYLGAIGALAASNKYQK